jgi:hypothetical protein
MEQEGDYPCFYAYYDHRLIGVFSYVLSTNNVWRKLGLDIESPNALENVFNIIL